MINTIIYVGKLPKRCWEIELEWERQLNLMTMSCRGERLRDEGLSERVAVWGEDIGGVHDEGDETQKGLGFFFSLLVVFLPFCPFIFNKITKLPLIYCSSMTLKSFRSVFHFLSISQKLANTGCYGWYFKWYGTQGYILPSYMSKR